MADDRLTILQGDGAALMRQLDEGSIPLVVTSPPYDNLRTYGGHSWDFEEMACGIGSVLCAGGVCCWIVGDSVIEGSESLTSFKQAIYFVEQVGLRLHDTMIYEKLNFGQPSHNRYHQMFEYVFVLSKGKLATFNPICDKRNVWSGTGTFGRNTIREANGEIGERPRNIITEFGMRGNVWKGKTSGQEAPCGGAVHPAMMPEWLAHDLILSWSNPGDVVLDPFAGSGTTGMAALELGRRTILFEINPDYIPVIERRCHVTPGLALA